jgi:hypothetical protein
LERSDYTEKSAVRDRQEPSNFEAGETPPRYDKTAPEAERLYPDLKQLT